MKNLNLLSKAEMKRIIGGNLPSEGDDGGDSGARCKSDVLCAFDGVDGYTTGGCATMQTGQCRCVGYRNGSAYESVPHSGCLN